MKTFWAPKVGPVPGWPRSNAGPSFKPWHALLLCFYVSLLVIVSVALFFSLTSNFSFEEAMFDVT